MVYSDWPSMSMKPGATTWRRASMVRLRGASRRFPIAAIFPSRIPISPEYQGEPVPSMMWPLMMTISNGCSACLDSTGTIPKSKTTDKNTDFHRWKLPFVIICSQRSLFIGLKNQTPAHNRGDYLRCGNFVRVNVEDILRKNDQVGKLADFQRAFRFFAASGKRCSEGVAVNCLRHG